MANKNSQTKKKSSSKNNSSIRFSKFGARNIIMVAVFVLVFAGIGGYYWHKSFAAGGCIYLTLQNGSSGSCVSTLQNTLGVTHNYDRGVGFAPRIDGLYGKETHSAVWQYQKYWLHQSNPGGIVISITRRGQTWGPLCSDLKGAYAHYKYAGLTSWRNRAASDYSGLGCSNIYGNL